MLHTLEISSKESKYVCKKYKLMLEVVKYFLFAFLRKVFDKKPFCYQPPNLNDC